MKMVKSSVLTFDEVRLANVSRAKRWHKPGTIPWISSDWSNAMAGEAGEVCNAVKKLRRLDTNVESANITQPRSRDAAIAAIKKEIGDTFIYLDLLADHLNIDMQEAVREAFNQVSEREGFPEKLLTLRRVITFEEAEETILRLGTEDTHKFAIQLGYTLDRDEQDALERLMLRDWIRLIDISTVAAMPGKLMRIFRIMPEAVAWLTARGAGSSVGADDLPRG